MKKLMLSVFALAAIVLSASAADNNSSQTKSTTAKANLYKGLTVTNPNSQGINFGTIAVGATDANVTLTPAASATNTFSDVSATNISGTTPTAAMFNITGQSGKTFTITLPPTAVQLGTNEATVTNFTCSVATAGTATITGGSLDIYVGAKLNYTVANVTGTNLSANFDVVVAYN